jgi:hypothetical protein
MPMQPTLIVALLPALFVATHIGMATTRTRARMVNRLGENLFVELYSSVASAQLGLLLAYYAAHRFDGAAGGAGILGLLSSLRGRSQSTILLSRTLAGDRRPAFHAKHLSSYATVWMKVYE